MPTLTLIKISDRPRKAIQQSVSYGFPPTAVLWNDSWLFTLLSHRFWCVYFTTLMQICQEVYFLFFPINFFKRDAKEWEGISGLVSEPCNSKAFGKLLKAFKKISNSLRSDSEIFLNNATSQIPRITMNPQMRPKSLPIPSLCTDKLTYIPFSTACRIACFLHHRRRLI